MAIWKKGKSWYVQYYIDGKQTRHVLRGVTTEKEARARYAKELEQVKAGISPGNRGRTRFDRFCKDWLDHRATLVMLRDDDEITPDTLKADTSRVNVQIVPVLGRYRIDQIGPREIEAAKRHWKSCETLTRARTPLSPKSVANIYGTLRKIMADAVRWRFITRNPCLDVTPPPIRTRKLLATPLEDAKKLVDYPSLAPVHVCCVTALFTGLRRGELLALRREDLDLEQGTLWCARSLTIYAGKPVLKDIKTHNDRGRRLQALSPMIHALLAAYVEANPGIPRDAPLFSGVGTADAWSARAIGWTPEAYSSAERIHLRRVGIATSAQRLRHAFNSLSNAAGVELSLRAVLMGHSSSKLTETTYQTVWLDQKRAAVAQLEALISAPKGPTSI